VATAPVLARFAGIVLILIGVLVLMWGEIPNGEQRHTTDIGPIEVHTSEKKALPVPTIAAVTALIAGAATLAVGFGRPAGRTTP